ncbi:MAG: hypothetical protein JO132_01470, partial [Streptosporangiaceae bacterium]|nr:hypothetical protein [Streptosporangiaceae bacterium]
AAAAPAAAAGGSRREQRRAARQQFDPPSLVAARNAPMLPEPRSLLEFGHPATALIGLGFWLGYTLVHARVLAWIAFGLVAATACAGLAWLAANLRAARRRGSGEPGPSFAGRVAVVHGGAAAVTVTLAAVTAFVAR